MQFIAVAQKTTGNLGVLNKREKATFTPIPPSQPSSNNV